MTSIHAPQFAIGNPFSAVLLAGGQSNRMGRDKAGLLFAGEPLWQRQLATLRAAGADQLLISGPAHGPYADAGLPILADAAPGLGPLAGLAAALRHARCEWLLVLAIDLPDMRADFLAHLAERAAAQGRGLIPHDAAGLEPLAAVYPRACLPLAEEHLRTADRSMHGFIERAVSQNLVALHPLTSAQRPLFRNLNTPADLL